MAKKKKETKQVSNEVIVSEIEKHIADIEELRDEYRRHYDAMKEIEKQITIKAGAVSALKSLIETEDEPAKDISGGISLNPEGESI